MRIGADAIEGQIIYLGRQQKKNLLKNVNQSSYFIKSYIIVKIIVTVW